MHPPSSSGSEIEEEADAKDQTCECVCMRGLYAVVSYSLL